MSEVLTEPAAGFPRQLAPGVTQEVSDPGPEGLVCTVTTRVAGTAHVLKDVPLHQAAAAADLVAIWLARQQRSAKAQALAAQLEQRQPRHWADTLRQLADTPDWLHARLLVLKQLNLDRLLHRVPGLPVSKPPPAAQQERAGQQPAAAKRPAAAACPAPASGAASPKPTSGAAAPELGSGAASPAPASDASMDVQPPTAPAVLHPTPTRRRAAPEAGKLEGKQGRDSATQRARRRLGELAPPEDRGSQDGEEGQAPSGVATRTRGRQQQQAGAAAAGGGSQEGEGSGGIARRTRAQQGKQAAAAVGAGRAEGEGSVGGIALRTRHRLAETAPEKQERGERPKRRRRLSLAEKAAAAGAAAARQFGDAAGE